MSIFEVIIVLFGLLGITGFGTGIYLYLRSVNLQKIHLQKEQQTSRKMYELAILKELGERVGYSLNIQNIVDIITGSLHQFIEYDVVSYMLLQPENIIFKAHLENSVSRKFIDDVKSRMISSLSALLNKEFQKSHIDEILSGAILAEEIEEPVRSFFNIPLVIGDKVVGVLTVADTKVGLYKEEETTILYKITQQASHAVTRLQEVIQTEQGKLNAMVASMTEGVIMTDKNYRIAVLNPAIKKALGLENTPEITIFDLIDHLEGKFDIRGKLEESVKLDKMLVTDEVKILEHYYQIFVSPVKNKTNVGGEEIIGGVVIFHDISHDKELKQMREDFSAMMVHELRSPLDGIKKMADALCEGKIVKGQKEQKQYFRLFQQSAASMLGLVNDLLDVAKLEAGKFQIHPVIDDIRSIIKGRQAFFLPNSKENKINFTSVIDKNIPTQWSFDPTRISQVLDNLISNALKFTPEGGQVTIQAFWHKEGADVNKEAENFEIKWLMPKNNPDLKNLEESIIIALTDTGRGIAEDKISSLFSKFSQVQEMSNTLEKKGTGLGLVIVKKIVESHGGKVGIASKEGTGSTFYFTIPFYKINK